MTDSHLYFSLDYGKKLDENGSFTRDIPSLNLYENHYAFLYGTLKKGYSRHSAISSSRDNIFCGNGVTYRENFDMLIADPGNFPVVFENTQKTRHHKIKGELWLLNTETLIKIDHIENNGYIYERELQKILVGKEGINAWMYFGNKDFWRNKELKDSPKFLQQNASSIPFEERTAKHYHHFFNEGISAKLLSRGASVG